MSLESDSPLTTPRDEEGRRLHSPRPPLPPPPRSSTLSSSTTRSNFFDLPSSVSPSHGASSPVTPSGVEEFAQRGTTASAFLSRDLDGSNSSQSSRRSVTSSSGASHTGPSTSFTSSVGGEGAAAASSTSSLLPPSPPQSNFRSPINMPYPPPPVSLPAAYDHPSLPIPSSRRPLPTIPAGASRFVPLHPLPPLAISGGKGKQRAPSPSPEQPDPDVEAKRAYVRARGMDDLDAPPVVSEATYSPASSELPQYAEDPLSPEGSERRRSLLKRAMSLDDGTLAEGEGAERGAIMDKAARAADDVRQYINEDARRQVEADQGDSKARFARRRLEEEEEEERRRTGSEAAARAEMEVRKSMEVMRIREDEERRAREEERLERMRREDPPPPLSPTGMGILPLGEKQRPVAAVAAFPSFSEKIVSGPPLPAKSLNPASTLPTTEPYRLPPPPVPTSTEFLPSTYATAPLARPPLPASSAPSAQGDYFSLYPAPSPRPPLHTSHTAPAPSSSGPSTLYPPPPLPPSRPEASRHASLEPSRFDLFYSGGISPYGASGRYVPTPAPRSTEPRMTRGAGAGLRHGSLGPPSAFYGAGVGLAIGKDIGSLASPPSRDSSYSPTSPTASVFADSATPSTKSEPTGGLPGGSGTIRHRQSMSWSQPSASLPSPATFPPAVSTPLVTGALQPTTQFGVLSQSTASPSLVQTHPHLQPRLQNLPSLTPPASTTIAAAPAFYTSLTPGGPLLPFYPSPSADGGAPTSFFSPTGNAPPAVLTSSSSLPFPPPPPQPYHYASFSPPPTSTSSLAGTSATPQRTLSATELRPWSRSSSGSPSQLQGQQESGAAERPGRTQRISTIRNLFGRKGGKGAGLGGGLDGLPGTPEEEAPR